MSSKEETPTEVDAVSSRLTFIFLLITCIGPFAACSVTTGYHVGNIFSRVIGIAP